MQTPLRFLPYLRPLVWGGRRLGEVLGKELPDGRDGRDGREGEAPAEPEAYGESWEVSDHASHRSVVADGRLAGRTLRQLMETAAPSLLGPESDQYAVFPWLVKYLDARDWLSVQVHPDETAVRTLWPGEGSKTEAWFILDAAPGSRVYAGLLPGVDEAALRSALKTGTVAECLHQFEPRAGDCLFLPAGTVHAVGGGVLMAEVQQTSDATFRLFDWNRRDAQGRPRTLHVEQALACLHWDRGPVRPVRAEGYPQALDEAGTATPVRQRLVSCRYFELDYVRQTEPFEVAGGQLRVVMGLHGQGGMEGAGGRTWVERGTTLVLPAGAAGVRCRPQGPLGLLVATLPSGG